MNQTTKKTLLALLLALTYSPEVPAQNAAPDRRPATPAGGSAAASTGVGRLGDPDGSSLPGGTGRGSIPLGAPSSVEETLQALNIDLTQTPRVDDDGEPLPDSYTPFGKQWELAKTNELLVMGVEVNGSGVPIQLFEITDDDGFPAMQSLKAIDDAAAPWARETTSSRAFPQSLRSAVSGDVDGDGLEEVVFVQQEGQFLSLDILQDEEEGLAVTQEVLAIDPLVTHVAAQTGDFDGDGVDDLVIGLTTGGIGKVVFYRRDGSDGSWDDFGPTFEHTPTLVGANVDIVFATGNLDHDAEEELVVVVNEYLGSTNSPSGTSSYLVHDDAETGFAILRQDLVHGFDEAGIDRIALRAAPSIGDVDGDGLGEVLLGGVRNFARYCNTQEYVAIALEDAEQGVADLAVHPYSHFFQDCSSPADPQIRYVHLHTLDIDGDGRDEIQANQFIFEDFVESAPWTVNPDWTIPEEYIWNQGNFGHVDSTTSSFVVGDFTGDAREDIAFYVQDEPIGRVWGVDQIDGAGVQRGFGVTFYNSQTPRNPVLLPVNVDTDSPVLRYSEGTYRQVFSEPIVVAALAAPPCQEGIGQNIDACSTQFGNTSTTGTESERSISVSAGATVGVKVDGGAATQSEAEFKVTATAAASRVTSESYELSRTILFTSGPAEDLVVLTTIPLDVYEYTLLSHPDPEMVGRQIVVSIPRDPITLQVERSYFNRSLQDGIAAVGPEVFVHTIGDISSYSDTTRKNQLLALHDGLDVGPVSVGQGSGSTSVSLEVAEEITEGQALDLSFETEVEATGGTILGGFTVGTSVGSSLSITAGQSTSYTGTVGAIDEEHFAEERFDFGLFTYVYTDPLTGRKFEVLDYWVD